MLGTIIGIDDNQVLLKIAVDVNRMQSLINSYVIMEDSERQCIGEITDIKDGIAYVNLLGEIVNNEFVFGVINKPSFGSAVKLISKEKVPLIIGVDNYRDNLHLNIGKSALYKDVTIGMNINSFFGNHFAIFGSTGSGKSCSVARIFQNLFEKQQAIPYRASIFIFDAYGEYHKAFSELNTKNPNISFKSYTTNTKFPDSEVLKIPPWLLSIDDYALLLGADKPSQLPIIEKALKLVSVFGRDEELVLKHKNDIISRALLDILSSGRPAAQIRDQLVSTLSTYNTRELNLETPIYQPGYTRPLKQCLFIDNTGKIRDIETISTFFESFLTDNLELSMPDGSFKYTLKDLKDAFDFALISEGVLKSDRIYDESNSLKVRLSGLATGDYSSYFDVPEYISKEQFIRELITAPNGHKAQIINFNINYVDDR